MQGYACSIAVAACLLAMSGAHAAPQDPARIDGAQTHDPAAVFSAPAVQPSRSGSWASKANALVPEGGMVDRAMQQASGALNKYGMRQLTDDDYRAAYGNGNIRERLGRTYAGGGSGDLYAGGQGTSWLERMMQDGGDGIANADWSRNTESLQQTMDEFSRQLMPALRDFRDSVSDGLDRASSKRQR